MGKNDFLIGVFALATMTFAACSNEDKLGEERSNGNGNTEVVEGEPTWAKFIFKLGKDSGKSRATGDEHEGTVAEKNIKICELIFSMNLVALKQRLMVLLWMNMARSTLLY